MQGVPGSGKSYWAKQKAAERGFGGAIVSADDYFMADGVYRFDPAKLGAAHADCGIRFLDALQRQQNIIVDNTNLANWQIAPYVFMASMKGGYNIRIVRVECDPNLAFVRNTHGVPRHAHKRMVKAFNSWKIVPAWKPKVKVVKYKSGV